MQFCDTISQPVSSLPFLIEFSEYLLDSLFDSKEIPSHLIVLFAAIKKLLLVVTFLIRLQNTPLDFQFTNLFISLSEVFSNLLHFVLLLSWIHAIIRTFGKNKQLKYLKVVLTRDHRCSPGLNSKQLSTPFLFA